MHIAIPTKDTRAHSTKVKDIKVKTFAVIHFSLCDSKDKILPMVITWRKIELIQSNIHDSLKEYKKEEEVQYSSFNYGDLY